MRTLTLPLMLATSLALTAPAPAQNLEDIIGGIADNLLQQELDKQAYVAAQNANTVVAYQNYLKKYPKGIYKVNAERALAKLGAASEASTAAQVEVDLGITRTQRIAVQKELTRLGYGTGGADGAWGKNTRTAIATWQRDRGDKVTGYLTAAQLKLLAKGSVVTPPVVDPPAGNVTAAQVEADLRLTRTQRSSIQKQLAALGYDAGVADGLWGSKTRVAIAAWQKANKRTSTGYVTSAQVKLIASQAGTVEPPPVDNVSGPALEESLLDLTRAERLDVQQRLARLGYDNARDGTFGAGTRRAIAAWQGDEGLAVTGYLTADQVRLIRVETVG